MSFKGMPPGFYHPKLSLEPIKESLKKNSRYVEVIPAKEKDFCIELFSDDASDSMFYNLCKSMKLYISDFDTI